MLARSYTVLGRPEDTARAMREIINRDEAVSVDDWRGYVGALLAERSEEDIRLSEDLEFALNGLLEASPEDPLAMFYYGLAARNEGEFPKALDYWQRLRAVVPQNAPILEELDRLIATVTPE